MKYPAPHRKLNKMNKKAFISDSIVDIWAIVIFVVVVMVFAIIFKWDAEAREQAISDRKDVTYGNYMSQVFLRKPVDAGGEKLTVAELIAIYDYTQTESEDRELREPEDNTFFFGEETDLWNNIESSIKPFTEYAFDKERCWYFGISGNGFEFSRFGACPMRNTFTLNRILERFEVPKDTFITYLAPIDPRDEPIKIYSVYDLTRLVELYSPDTYTDMDDWSAESAITFCTQHPALKQCAPGYKAKKDDT